MSQTPPLRAGPVQRPIHQDRRGGRRTREKASVSGASGSRLEAPAPAGDGRWGPPQCSVRTSRRRAAAAAARSRTRRAPRFAAPGLVHGRQRHGHRRSPLTGKEYCNVTICSGPLPSSLRTRVVAPGAGLVGQGAARQRLAAGGRGRRASAASAAPARCAGSAGAAPAALPPTARGRSRRSPTRLRTSGVYGCQDMITSLPVVVEAPGVMMRVLASASSGGRSSSSSARSRRSGRRRPGFLASADGDRRGSGNGSAPGPGRRRRSESYRALTGKVNGPPPASASVTCNTCGSRCPVGRPGPVATGGTVFAFRRQLHVEVIDAASGRRRDDVNVAVTCHSRASAAAGGTSVKA